MFKLLTINCFSNKGVCMAKDVGVLVVSYGSREAAIVDALKRSEYRPAIYVADKQANPFNIRAAQESGGEHAVIPRLAVDGIYGFAKKHRKRIHFVMPGCEAPIIGNEDGGLRDMVEGGLGIPVIAPTREYALEASKVRQRQLMFDSCPEANPKYMVFDPRDYGNDELLKVHFNEWVSDELGGVSRCVIKPDEPGFGKGVGVGGEHFHGHDDAWEHFLSLYEGKDGKGKPVIVEKRVDGEEFSLQFFTDGRTLVSTPAARDYKRALDGDLGPNTGGMGSYKGSYDYLHFMKESEWDAALDIGNKVFNGLKAGKEEVPALKGVLYFAFICTGGGKGDSVKVLEINSRPGDPEWQNLMPIAGFDLVDKLDEIAKGRLTPMDFKDKLTVVTYAAPLDYGGYIDKFTGYTMVNLGPAEELRKKYGDNLRIYPGSMEVRNGLLHTLGSRTVCTVGIGDSIQEARGISLEAIRAIDGPLRHREDIASPQHIQRSEDHMNQLRRSKFS
jgi:phosphoribosylamine--glycine ligase